MAKILVVHASPRTHGNSAALADAFAEGAHGAGNEVHRIQIGHAHIGGCLACEYCFKHGGACVQQDDMQRYYPLMKECDTVVYAFPLYTYSYPAQVKAFMDRMFCAVGNPGLFGFRQAAILVSFGDEDPHTADGLVRSFEILADYCHYRYLGAVLAHNVYAAGDIAGHPALQQARELGESIS